MDNKKSSENKSTQGNCEYDNDPVFLQGIAIVSKNKKYGAIMVGGKEIVPPIYDALSDFVDGFATAKYRNEERTINLSGQIQVKKGEEYVFLPQEYDWGNDFVDNICIVEKIYRQINWQTVGQFGIISVKNNPNSTEISFEVLLSCEYSSIRPLKDGFFLIVKDSRCGLINSDGKIIAETKYCQITIVAEKYFQLDAIEPYLKLNHNYCIIDEKGDPMTPYNCSEIKHISINNMDYWIVSEGEFKGVYCNNSQIIPVFYKEIKQLSDSFECIRFDEEIVKYNLYGQVVLNYSGSQIVFPSDCSIVLDSPIGLFRASKDRRWGIINQKKEWVVPNKYVYIYPFQNGYAKIIEGVLGGSAFSDDDIFKDCYCGLIDTIGNVVLPTEYNELSYIDGYWIVCKDYKYGLLSSSLSEIIPPTYSKMEHLKNGFFIVTQDGDKLLIDNTGKEILAPASFDEIELFGDSFFKLIYNKAGCFDRDWISIVNQNGKTIVEYDDYREITYLGDGLMVLDKRYDGKYLVNFQGERIYEWSYDEIKKRDNGLFSLRSKKRWGVGDVSGNIIIDIEYLDEIVFDNDTATIRVDETILADEASFSCEQKVNREGVVIVHDGEKEIELPKGVYWGTDFSNGISIVRGKRDSYYKRNVIGVADVNGNIIIPAKYTKISLLSNNTIRVIDEDCCGVEELTCFGLYDLMGNCIFPPIFTSIKFVAEDRVRVCWNINIAKEWNNAGYIPGLCEEKDKQSVQFLEGYRAALCNSKGEMVSDKEYLYVGKFINQYAPAYKEIKVEDEKVRCRMGGVIDVTGKTIIIPQYDTIKLIKDIPYIVVWKGGKVGIIDYSNKIILEPIYDALQKLGNSHFARVKKDGKIGIVDLQSKRERFFEGLNIQRTGRVDSLGRCAYSEESEKGTWGVMSIDGIVVPTGKYKGVKLLDNGLIRVSVPSENRPEKPLYGLLDKHGKEILPIIYTKISSFENNRAEICLGGKYDENDEIKNGKWGVIDITGKIIVECKFDGIWIIGDGTIEVSDKSGEIPVYGLMDENGNEVLPIKYSSLSSFVNGRAAVRIGGHKVDETEATYEQQRGVSGGKWSVIDKNGNAILDEITISYGTIDDINLQDNGLMIVKEVWRNDSYYVVSEYGLLDENGNEILPVRYSFIGNFKDGLALVCLSEEYDWDEEGRAKERWGIIDSKGKFIKECKYTWEEVYGETDENNDNKEFQAPSVVLSDTVECDDYLYYGSYERDTYDDDNSGYRKYGGYNGYDDNTIDEAFEGDPSLTWNND